MTELIISSLLQKFLGDRTRLGGTVCRRTERIRATMTDNTTLPTPACSTCLALPWLDPPSGRTVLTSKTHHADPDKLVFAMIKPRWYPNLVGSAREERYGHRDGCL